jgi:hypothetical protein
MSDKEKAPSEHLLGANLSSRGPKKKNQVHFTFLCLSRKNLHGSPITLIKIILLTIYVDILSNNNKINS